MTLKHRSVTTIQRCDGLTLRFPRHTGACRGISDRKSFRLDQHNRLFRSNSATVTGHSEDNSFVGDFFAFYKEILCSDCGISHGKIVIVKVGGCSPDADSILASLVPVDFGRN
jgi:hypothetical protein